MRWQNTNSSYSFSFGNYAIFSYSWSDVWLFLFFANFSAFGQTRTLHRVFTVNIVHNEGKNFAHLIWKWRILVSLDCSSIIPCKATQGLFTWRWGTPGRWGNPLIGWVTRLSIYSLILIWSHMIGGVTRRRVTSLTLGLPPKCKQALKLPWREYIKEQSESEHVRTWKHFCVCRLISLLPFTHI